MHCLRMSCLSMRPGTTAWTWTKKKIFLIVYRLMAGELQVPGYKVALVASRAIHRSFLLFLIMGGQVWMYLRREYIFILRYPDQNMQTMTAQVWPHRLSQVLPLLSGNIIRNLRLCR